MPVARQRALWALAMVVAAVQVWAGLHLTSGASLADLRVYLGSLETLHAGGALYDYAAPGTGAPFTYPPFAALVFAPLPLLPFVVVATLWTAGTLAAVAGIARLVRPAGAAFVALALVASAPVSSNLRYGQISVFLVLLVLADALRVVPERYRGIATGVAGAIKLTPLIFVPYYWFSGQRRTAITSVVSFVTATALAWIVLPAESTRFWFTTLFNVNRVGNISTGGNQSLNGVLLRWDIDDHIRTPVVALIGAVVVILALWRATRAHRAGDDLTAAVLVGAAGLVFSPVSWTHHQIWLVLAAFLVVSRRTGVNVLWTVLALAIMIVPVLRIAEVLSDEVITGNARVWLAVAVAALIPFRHVSAPMTPSPLRVTAP
ncbi:glycosyltransferase 87 family protein [Actinoplanes couchii]|uniref:Membrane protein n=1 Tax=Actinoplanes couchii TaxID=403638 RepID=A0ABQ3XBA9_9ACTN|nr:glycosyltransferase 87 family protein [Actinoplanes couchii]MDR6323257.1 alpha-1,2-mannosyltransferase [Actinoplanes couchii]GID55771.1 membrane protein [Actinoplanes couchii]